MDSMGMSSMGGMDMSNEGPFRPTNQRIAHCIWYGIAIFIGVLMLIRFIHIFERRRRQDLHRQNAERDPTVPQGSVLQAYATAVATVRELSYSQPTYFTGRFSKYFSPLPIGRWLLLIVYWTVLLCFLWTDTIISPSSPMYGYKWEKVGFRAAWVSVAQIPFIYLLSCKFNPISLLTGISYERFNWVHRWAARTVFLTIIVHWSFFFHEWRLASFVTVELQLMPMVKYGFGAWAVIGWMVLSGFGFFRSLNYELFVAQHICAAATLLWLLLTHVPGYAKYNIYMAIGFVAFDWTARIIWGLFRNTHVFDRRANSKLGYIVRLEALQDDMTRVVIENADFDWKAGQHAYISIPRLRPFELHPFSIANTAQNLHDGEGKQLTMLIKAHSGFSRTLHNAAVKCEDTSRTYRAFLSGPWGSPPSLVQYDTVVLMACASGASFIVPILEDLVRKPGCVRTITLHWMIRSQDHLRWFREELLSLVESSRNGSTRLQVFVHVTQPLRSNEVIVDPLLHIHTLQSGSATTSSSTSISSLGNEKTPLTKAKNDASDAGPQLPSLVLVHAARPSVESLIRPAVEAAQGETAVVVCGGISITAQTRTFVSALSDERAVHKGSGAQGIFLFTETYGF